MLLNCPLLCIHTCTQPEPITGSSRMKSGTATKIILETLFILSANKVMELESQWYERERGERERREMRLRSESKDTYMRVYNQHILLLIVKLVIYSYAMKYSVAPLTYKART